MHKLLRSFLLAMIFVLTTGLAHAQTDPPLTDVAVTYEFGRQFTISGRIDPGAALTAIDLQIAFPGDPHILSVPIHPAPDGAFTFTHLISDRFVRAFSTVGYEFVLTAADGGITTSDPYTFFYADNRFEWQELSDGPVTVRWYDGDAAYARRILDAALDGLTRSQAILEHANLPSVEIYAYASLEEYQFARGQFGQAWSGGHTDPSTGIVLASLPPGSEIGIEIERKVPHEVAHVSLYHSTGPGFWNLPVWLNEGYASMLETTPNPDYDFLVSSAIDGDGALPLAELCSTFPADASGALLAYAEATSVVRFIQGAYGPAGLRALIQSYAGGASCAQGPLAAPIALELSGLESAWREFVLSGAEPAPTPAAADLEAYGPFLVLAAAVFLAPGLVLIGAGLRRNRSSASK